MVQLGASRSEDALEDDEQEITEEREYGGRLRDVHSRKSLEKCWNQNFVSKHFHLNDSARP